MRPMLSLTFDDGLPVQIWFAVPRLDERGMKATFFIIQNSPYDDFRRDIWRKFAMNGHEIGAHSVNHLKPAEVGEEQARADVRYCKSFLERELAAPVASYAHPFTHVTPAVRDEAQKHYKQARGGRVARADKFIVVGDGVDMFNLPCFHVGPNNVREVPHWVDEAIRANAWLILMFHGVGPDKSQWDNIESEDFERMLDAIMASGIAVLPLAEAAEEYRCAI